MATGVTIKGEDDLRGWLDDKPAECAQVLAARAALRALPLDGTIRPNRKVSHRTAENMCLAVFRANHVSWAASKYPAHAMANTAYAAASSIRAAANTAASAINAANAAAAANRAAAAANAAAAASNAANAAAANAAYAAAAAAAADDIWKAVTFDARGLDALALKLGSMEQAASELADVPLWLDVRPVARRSGIAQDAIASAAFTAEEIVEGRLPKWARAAIDELSNNPVLREAGFTPWIAWYRKLVPLGQDRPSSHFGAGLDILVATQPNEWWDRDAAEVNAEIAGWLHTHWTDERVEHLKKLWADGLSASQIAAQLGGVSRNAVIGRVHRLRLERSGRTSSAALERPTIRQFILQLLKSSEKPMSIAEINRSFADANHPIIPKTVRGELSRMASAGEIVRVRTGVYAANDNSRRPTDHELAAGLTSALTNIEEQKAGALQFETDGVAPIDVKRRASAGQLRADEAASKRHAELARRLNACLRGCGHADPGGNSTSALREELVLYGESLGETVGDVDPDLFIPRGDGLRIDLHEQEPRGDAVLGDPPWPDTVRKEVKKLVAAHNNFVAFDPELAKRDEALLGPDAKRQLVPPEAGHNAVSDAIEKRAATERVGEFLDEEGKVAPAIPDPENRQSRRYSEGAKNFARRAIELAGEFAIAAWTHKGKITVTTAGSGLAAAKWVVANRDWLLQYFSHNPTMVDIINKLLEILDKLPLL